MKRKYNYLSNPFIYLMDAEVGCIVTILDYFSVDVLKAMTIAENKSF